MPNCSKTKQKCGEACTLEGGLAYFKDCNTGQVGTGHSYTEAKRNAAKQQKKTTLVTPRRSPFSNIRKNVPRGSRFNTETDWKETEKLLGDPAPDYDPSTVGGFEGKCMGLPIDCGILAIIGGALVILLIILKR